MRDERALTERVIGCAIEARRTLEPGLLESIWARSVAPGNRSLEPQTKPDGTQ